MPQVLWVVQYNWLQWLLVVLGTVLSGAVLVITFWPSVSMDEKKVSVTIPHEVLIRSFHAGNHH